ncbi:sigma-70 family RNA polymerase sigma factor [Dysosmobacter sp.]|uniref:sigma-70 family RNA polymerase sigma factor n=1 Tax=Dysosmobacter sp. TaxID=2591382 RepID=UPI003AF108DC
MISAALMLFANTLLFSLRLDRSGSFPRPLSASEERMWLERLAQGDPEARNVLIERNLRLVAHIVKKYYAQSSDQDDLISIGTIGLIKGISSFDPSKGARLATYAARCIENAILSRMRLWFQTSIPRAEKNRDGVFWHRYPRICISFALLWTAA